MRALFNNLIDFFQIKKIFFNSIYDNSNFNFYIYIFKFKKSFHFKVKYNVGYDNKKLLIGISDSYKFLFYSTLDSIFDSNSKIQKLKKKE